MQPNYKVGDLVEVTGQNGVYCKGGYNWTDLKDDAIGHVYEVSEVDVRFDATIEDMVPVYELSEYNGDVPPHCDPGNPYHWVEDWLEHADVDVSIVEDQDFESIFD